MMWVGKGRALGTLEQGTCRLCTAVLSISYALACGAVVQQMEES
jgi:hypothetical protein